MLLPAGLDAVLAGVLGLLVGSFLNVVVHRYPIVMWRGWWDEVLQTMEDAHKSVFGREATKGLVVEGTAVREALTALPPLTLSKPRSRCPHCGHQIRWYENIPVVSYLALRGKCSNCKAGISVRYPIVELVTSGLFVACALQFGAGWLGLAWAVFASLLVALFLIDLDTMYLPDELTLPLLWLGLIVAALGWSVPLTSAVWGAVFGYLILWSVYQGYLRLTGKIGMGHGDFKLMAALGAWFGVQSLLALVLLSSVVGSIIGGAMLLTRRLASRDVHIPFGPYIAGAGLAAMVIGPQRLAQWVPFAFPFGTP